MTRAAAFSCNKIFLLPWATEVATHGTFMLGLDKVEDMSKLEPGKLHELTLVLS